ncbi:MAG: hypothetical protein JXB05_00530 [Myxococcaceae bacterium]|nr:hypothetical protein [Myxococcaceae bacterium]
MSQPIWGGRSPAWSRTWGLVGFLWLITAPEALAERRTINPDTQLSLELTVKGATTCIVVPQELYDPQVCEGIPRSEVATPPAGAQGVRAVAILRQDTGGVVLTVASIHRPGIGQMHEQQIHSFIQSTMKRLSGELGAPTHAVDGAAQKPFTVQQVGGVPVVRWEYTADLPDTDPRANTASAVVYLVPSIDALDIISLNTHRQNLEATRGFGEQVISTLRVPLTIDAEAFGDDMIWALGAKVGMVLIPVVLVLGGGVWLWRRARRAS